MNQSQTISTLNTSIQKAKSDFQQITTQNKSLISQMKIDNSEYTDQLINQKQKNTVVDTQLALSVIKAQEECALIAQKIEIETKKKQDLENLVNAMKTSAKDISKIENTNSGSELTQVQKAVRDAELKLQQIHIKHNEQLAEVEAEKEQLNLSRRERVIYSTVFKGIEKDAIFKQREYQNCIRQNELLKEEQKFLQDQLKLIKELADKEQTKFQQEYDDLFKPQKDEQQEQQSMASDQKSQVQGPYLTEQGDQSKPILKERSESQQEQKDVAQQVLEYEAQFNKLYLETGFNNVEAILKQYYNQEIWIDEIYKEINEINQEIEQTEQKNEKIQQYLQKFKQMAKAPIKEQVNSEDSKIERISRGIDQNKKQIAQIQQQYMRIQEQIGVEIINGDDDETTLLPKIEQLEKIIDNILLVSNQYIPKQDQKKQKKGTVKFDDDKSEISGTKQHTELKSQTDHQNDLDIILTEVEKRKTLAESRHTKEELQKESTDQMVLSQNKKQNSKRSKHQQSQY
ncbi:unnamed protein product [Paramecium primaurelia]|uniref:ODAD1 central coiled coil region domain-containing protein n=1 Tax=Paramecium primaurelia TaxID=5886 RepID=A0A8S1M3U8_PARPR|nr:unnamed protein product [Paramecium primaurelia]